MEWVGIPLLLMGLLVLGSLLVLGGALLLLLKLGVIGHYATRQEPPQAGEYGLEQSSNAGQNNKN
jgi:hypothetical protein